MKVDGTRKLIKCPVCAKKPVATILYGMPNLTYELEQVLNDGETIIGDCLMNPDRPAWECLFCGQKIYQKVKQ